MDDKILTKTLNNQKFFNELMIFNYKSFVKSKICGDINVLKINTNKDNKIIDIGYCIYGCKYNVFFLEKICKFLLNKNIQILKETDFKKMILKDLEFSENKIHCIDLCIDLLNNLKKLSKKEFELEIKKYP
jgi:NifU-like protein involved in Fe-S cluster formation